MIAAVQQHGPSTPSPLSSRVQTGHNFVIRYERAESMPRGSHDRDEGARRASSQCESSRRRSPAIPIAAGPAISLFPLTHLVYAEDVAFLRNQISNIGYEVLHAVD